jgi:hypothetical protein
MPMRTHTEVRVVEVASREGEGEMGGVVVGIRVEGDRATKRQAPMTRPSVPPSECHP